MRFSSCLSILALAAEIASASRSLQHVGKKDIRKPILPKREPLLPPVVKRSHKKPSYLNDKSKKFVVDGAAIPDVNFDIGESYAGLLPISDKANETSELYFWFVPSENPKASNEVLIWLNGGPGCSSLEGFLQENGPFQWQYGTFKPVQNPWSWTNLTNVVWIEQPVGTGFSQGTPTAASEKDVAEQFLGFWKNFMDTFEMHKRKVFITGESYAGYYVPYIADAMLNQKNKTYFDLEATMVYDPSTTFNAIAEQAPVVQLADYHQSLFPFNDTFKAYIHNKSDACGYTDYMNKYLQFPPPGPFPTQLPGADAQGNTLPECDVFDDVFYAASILNPCFDIYQIATTCPLLWDVLGFPGSFNYLPSGAEIYFNRTDVKKAINAPDINWMECTNVNVFPNGPGGSDASVPSGTYGGPLASVIERSDRTIIVHAALDMVLIANGTLLMIQNMTWNGKQGFHSKPTDPLYIPYHGPTDPSTDPRPSTIAGSGVMGTTHSERGLTWVGVDLSGHMVPQYAPSVGYRTLEFLLGRIRSLTSTEPFTTLDYPQSQQPLGKGTAPPY